MEKLTPEQEQACLKAEIAGFIAQDVAGRGAEPEKSAAFYKRAVAAFAKRAEVRNNLKAEILKTLPAAA